MSNQPREQSKPETKPEKKTDTTTILSPEELRAIAGGATQPPKSTGPQPKGMTKPTH